MTLIAKNTKTLINPYGKTKDIAETVISVYLDTYKSVDELAHEVGNDGFQTVDKCEAIFNYVVQNVHYNEDPFGVQWVKEPARLLADKSGDCKSMAILICSALKCLGIPHFFRFVSFNSRKEATHVYAVALDEYGNEIYIDPVVRPIQFNVQEKYTYKSDMNGTQIYRLAGIRSRSSSPRGKGFRVRSYIGAPNPSELWFGEFPEIHTKQKLSILSFIDLGIETAGITPEKQVANIYTQLDFFSLVLYAYERNYTDKDSFNRAAMQIAGMSADGLLNNNSADLDVRETHLTDLKKTLADRIAGNYPVSLADKNVLDWVQINVMDVWEPEGIHGIGSTAKQQEIAAKIKQSGPYYLYTFATDSQLTIKALKKKRIQENVYSYVDDLDSYNNSSIQSNLVRTGCIAAFGCQPEHIFTQRKTAYKIAGSIGFDPVTVMTVISSLMGLIQMIVNLFKPKRKEPSTEEVERGAANMKEDMPGMFNPGAASGGAGTDEKTKNVTQAGVGDYLPYILGGAALLSLMKNN